MACTFASGDFISMVWGQAPSPTSTWTFEPQVIKSSGKTLRAKLSSAARGYLFTFPMDLPKGDTVWTYLPGETALVVRHAFWGQSVVMGQSGAHTFRVFRLFVFVLQASARSRFYEIKPGVEKAYLAPVESESSELLLQCSQDNEALYISISVPSRPDRRFCNRIIRTRNGAFLCDGGEIIPAPSETEWHGRITAQCTAEIYTSTPAGQSPAEITTRCTSSSLIPIPKVKITDMQNCPKNPLDEVVTITNNDTMPVDLTGWSLGDLAGHEFHFTGPTVSDPNKAVPKLDPNQPVKVFTKDGTDILPSVADPALQLFWGRRTAVWNNDGDTAYLHDNTQGLIDQLDYSGCPPSPPHGRTTKLVKSVTIFESSPPPDVDTGITLDPNDVVQIQASGHIDAGVFADSPNDPNGWVGWTTNDPKFPMFGTDDSVPYSLLGRFGRDGAWMFIGDGGRPTPRSIPYHSKDGTRRNLFLRINDDTPGNGSGQFDCIITVLV